METKDSLFSNIGVSWIWPDDQKNQVNQHVELRHEFFVDSPTAGAELAICVECNYVAWINGEFVGTGQFSDYPGNRTYDLLPVGQYLRKGKNILAVLANHWGEGHFSYIKDDAGLIYAITAADVVVVSGEDTQYRKSPCYRQGPIARLTPQLPFTFEYDSAGEDQWQSPDYTPDNRWANIEGEDVVSIRQRPAPHLRPLPKLDILPRTPSKIVAQGIFKRLETSEKTLAELMHTDFLSARTAGELFENIPADRTPVSLDDGVVIEMNCQGEDGVYMVLDLGKEEAGYLDLEFEAAAGTVVDIAFGEHLDDLRVRSAVGDRNFASRYISKDGRQRFTYYFTRFAGRYIQLHISQISSRFVLHYAGLVPAEYPLDARGQFRSPDNLQNKIYDVATRTLQLCMHEHYEDTPWREQGLYANDARNQALCGYYCFGEYRFPRVSLSLLGNSLKDDGYLELCAPAEIPITIPAFSMVWIVAIKDYLLFSGDAEFAGQVLPKIRRMMDIYISGISDGLLPSSQGKRYWHFYDWADGLTGGDALSKLGNQQVRLDGPFNLFFCMALNAAAMLARACRDEQHAEQYEACAQKLRTAFHQKFWDSQASAYQTYADKGRTGHFAELTQALAICAEACPVEVADSLAQRLASDNNGLVETTLSQSLYKFEAILRKGHKHSRWVFEKIDGDWGKMLFSGATSFWETMQGCWDFNNAGSLCHGWSAIPIYFYHAYQLGIQPIEPGFKTFRVDPVKSVVRQALGVVPTPHGAIKLSWEQIGDRTFYRLSHPRETKPVFPSISPEDQLQVTISNT